MIRPPPISTLFPYPPLSRSLLVVGSRSSSNSNRLRELADRAGVAGHLVDGPDELRREWFEGKRRSEEHTSELQSQSNLVCRLLLAKKHEQLLHYLDRKRLLH